MAPATCHQRFAAILPPSVRGLCVSKVCLTKGHRRGVELSPARRLRGWHIVQGETGDISD